MSFHKLMGKSIVWGFFAILIQSCTAGIDGGSIEKTFSGITAATVLGPETVEINWETNSNCNAYKIYMLSSSASDSVAESALPPVRLKSPTILSAQPYTFAVGCSGNSGVTGQDIVVDAVTWPKFNGVLSSVIDTTGQNAVLDLSWNYEANTGTLFQIFAKKSIVPGDLSSWHLTRPGVAGTAYSETPICESYKNSIRIGVGGDCTPNLDTGESYNFKVVAKYPDNSFSTDILGNGTNQSIPAAFTPPSCILTQAGVGADAASSYLFLRCGTSGGTCSSVRSQAFQVVGSSRNIVSDTMDGAGTLRIQPQIPASSNNSRLVTGLEIEYTCLSTTPNTKAVVRYDGSTATLKQPVLKYGNDGYEMAPLQSYEQHPSNLGQVSAIGDFNCDGKPDLALGLQNITYNYAPYYNKNSQSGAVRIYYSYAQSASGAFTGATTQYLTFRDLPPYARFGASLSVGNINRDVNYDSASANFYSCDDLIIGAPGPRYYTDGNVFSGAAYIFYGHPQKFAQPFDSAGLALNAPTCSGTITNEVCSPVRLSPDLTNWFKVDSGYSPASSAVNKANGMPYNSISGYGTSAFGWQVSYVNDYNADGYGDVVVSDPYCDWDGDIQNGYLNPNGFRETIREVGCVYVYWGGPAGLQNIRVGCSPDDNTAGCTNKPIVAPFVKVYPPMPMGGMHFGWSVSGGGDIDGRLPVPVPMNGGSNVILANGSDFIVGAPDFKYNATYVDQFGVTHNSDEAEGTNVAPTWTVDESYARNTTFCASSSGGQCPVDPSVMQGPTMFSSMDLENSTKLTVPWNGAWKPWTTIGGSNPWSNGSQKGPVYPTASNLLSSTGIAFAFLGRHAYQSYDLSIDDGLNKFPNQVSTSPLTTPIEQLLSKGLMDRQNGSRKLKVHNGISWAISPTDSFYNCGTRGSPWGASGSGTYKHLSCLAGRNNFSVIYPSLKSTDAAVTKFGQNVKILGAKDQNAIALYELGSLVNASAYKRGGPDAMDLIPLAQGNVDDRVRGTSLWEMGIKGLSVPGTTPNSCDTYVDATSPTNVQFDSSSCNSYFGFLSRSPLSESYVFPSAFNSPQKSAKPQTDVNQDGYADLAVSSSSGSVFTFYGNYAADFSYQGANNTQSPNCVITRLPLSSGDFNTSLPGVSSLAGSGINSGILPYTTFYTMTSATNVSSTPAYSIKTQYPEYFMPATGNYARLSFLDDYAEASAASISFNYQKIDRATKSTAAQSCLPFVKNYSTGATSLGAADMNNDGLNDLIIGFSADNSSVGKTIISTSGPAGNGFSVDSAYTVNSSYAKNGSSVSGTNWRFMDETSRRDLFSGAPGFGGGVGSIYGFTASNDGTMGAVATTALSEDSNFPNALMAQYSKIIGDVNGDGYEDILMPVRRVSVSGSVYYEAIIYYGSVFGPVTYNFCSTKLSSITNTSGGAVSISDCVGTTGGAIALMGGVQIRMPQYITMPTGVSTGWVMSVFPAGDVDHDGNSDILFLDYSNSSMYLFFGSTSGFTNGTPRRGPSVNHVPQLVTTSSNILSDSYGTNGFNQPVHSWVRFANAIVIRQNYNPSTQSVPLVNGDFNGDGFQDLAIKVAINSAGHDTNWTCTAGELANSLIPLCYDVAHGGTGPHNYQVSSVAGAVFVIYGGQSGYQTPMNGSLAPVEFDSLSVTLCPDFYKFSYGATTGCTYASTGTQKMNYVSEVYNTLNYNSSSGVWNLDTRMTACDPSTGTCKGELIRNPVFYDTPSSPGVWASIGSAYFGNALSVADTNHDGVDDLLVSDNYYSLPGYNTTDKTTVFGDNTVVAGNNPGTGRVYLYYGAKGAGLVAPDASWMVGDRGLGLDVTPAFVSNSQPAPNQPVFSIYPFISNPVQTADWPELETIGGNLIGQNSPATYPYSRMFGQSMSVGDFNGDGYDDMSVVSSTGQVYVYYGPLCQFDNARSTWQGTSYLKANHNIAVKVAAGTITSTQCSLFNLNASFTAASNTNVVSVNPASAKPLYPQMIYVTGTTAYDLFGSVMVSKRPIRSPASNNIIKRPGNIDGDVEMTDDLILGTNAKSDPNTTPPAGKLTGLGYVFFGHKDPGVGEMPSTPGIYIGNASYNSALISKTISGNTYFYHQPTILHPHTADGIVGEFFYYPLSLGDLNGDGSGDLIVPTSDLHQGADNTPVVNGGGYWLFY
jgi:hypothetical protein